MIFGKIEPTQLKSYFKISHTPELTELIIISYYDSPWMKEV